MPGQSGIGLGIIIPLLLVGSAALCQKVFEGRGCYAGEEFPLERSGTRGAVSVRAEERGDRAVR